MKDIGEGTIRRIDWTELTPVVLLLRVFNTALRGRILAIAAVWLGIILLLGNPFMHVLVNETGGWLTRAELHGIELDMRMKWESLVASMSLPFFFFYMLVTSIPGYILLQQGVTGLLSLFAVLISTILCGGAICRIVAVRLTIDESESTRNLFIFFRQRGIGFVTSLLILSLGILCCYLPIKIAAWLATVPYLDYAVAGLMPLWLLFSFFAAILTVGLGCGGTLLFAAVSVDGSDGFDAISRLFSYIYQRPLHYALYWFYCAILGYAGSLLVMYFVALTFGGIQSIPDVPYQEWWQLVGGVLVPYAYLFAWFWTSSVAIYLLLRRSVDAAPFNEVYRVAPPKTRYLPEVKFDEKGAPEFLQEEQK